MSDFLDYQKCKAERREAYEKYNYAGQLLENRQIKERLAEIRSQYDPINQISMANVGDREKLYATAFYVVVGRLPSDFPPPAPPKEMP